MAQDSAKARDLLQRAVDGGETKAPLISGKKRWTSEGGACNSAESCEMYQIAGDGSDWDSQCIGYCKVWQRVHER